MITLADLFPPDSVQYTETGEVPFRSPEQLAAMQARVVSAYGAVFSGRGTHDDGDLVLVDLAQFTRYLDTARIGASPEEVLMLNGLRMAFARIVEAIVQSGGDVDGLHRAVLVSPSLNDEET